VTERERRDVVIVGAGAAGLACARELAAQGVRSLLLEARDRLGGRIHTLRVPGLTLPLELGAEFVHGLPADTMAAAERGGLALVEVDGEAWTLTDGRLQRAEHFDDDADRVLDALDADRDPDRSVAEFLAERRARGASERAVQRARDYVTGFHAADPDCASERGLAREEAVGERLGGDRDFRVLDGYDRIVEQLRAEAGDLAEVRVGARVESVAWEQGQATVHVRGAADEAAYAVGTRAVVVTLPLGVLQRSVPFRDAPGAVRFDPEPPGLRSALAGLAVGHAARVVLRFRERFWERDDVRATATMGDLAHLGFVFTGHDAFRVWWTPYPVRAPVLTAWAGGPRALRLAGLGERAMTELAVAAAGRLFGVGPERLAAFLLDAHSHDWSADPLSLGAYSYTAVGGIGASAALARPVARTLFFAGEATTGDGEHGTVHAALESGARAAGEVLACMSAVG
jgi:monoamine oxidase